MPTTGEEVAMVEVGAGGWTPPDAPRFDPAAALWALPGVAARFAAIPWHRYRTVDLEQRTRWRVDGWLPGWTRVAPDDVEPFVAGAPRPLIAAGLLSMHHDGHVREAAVRELVRLGDPDALPFLVVRCVEWVAEVAALAHRGARGLLDDAGPDRLLAVLTLARPLAAGHVRGHALAGDVVAAAVERLDDAALVDGLTHPERVARRGAAALLVGRSGAIDALDPGLDQDDAVTAVVVGRAAVVEAGDDDDRLRTVLGRLRRSRLPSLRALAVARAERAGLDVAPAWSDEALLDRSGLVRSVAQAGVRSRGGDPRRRYRDELDRSSGAAPPPAAILGLGEVGAAEDAAVLRGRLADGNPRVRAAALAGLARIDGRGAKGDLLRALGDPAPAVRRSAVVGLRPVALTPAELDDLWRRAGAADTARRRALFRVFGDRDRWARLVLGSRAVVSGDPDLRERGLPLLRRGLAGGARVASRPSTVELVEVEAAVPALAGVLAEPEVSQLRRLVADAHRR